MFHLQLCLVGLFSCFKANTDPVRIVDATAAVIAGVDVAPSAWQIANVLPAATLPIELYHNAAIDLATTPIKLKPRAGKVS